MFPILGDLCTNSGTNEAALPTSEIPPCRSKRRGKTTGVIHAPTPWPIRVNPAARIRHGTW